MSSAAEFHIEVRDLRIQLPGFQLGPVSLEIPAGAFFTLMGPTGSGKTLLLESVAGLMRLKSGSIRLQGRDVTKAPPEKRRVGLVYQDHALFPHKSVLRNITYGQRYHGIDPAEGERLARELMDMLGLSDLAERKPEHLSGGEKQRTALARALACKPDIVLLDEPLSSLDPQFREGLRRNLKDLHAASRESGTTFFMVTHDFVDALALSSQAAVIREGRIEQSGATLDIFHRPATTFIADFVGMKNIFPATYSQGCCSFAGLEAPLPDTAPRDGQGHTALRPEDIHISPNGDHPEGWTAFPGTVASISRQGFEWLATVHCGEAVFTARLEHRLVLDNSVGEGSSVTLAFDPGTAHHIVG